MRIRAVRVRELGCFSNPIALEFSGELDVLAGPNELGKSTILKGLQALFTLSHTSQSQRVRELRPYSGGAPLIEADFEIDGGLWRLRKQFLSERSAVLIDLRADRVVARGEEAHRHTLELLGGDGEEHRLGLLWLEQGMSLQPAVPTNAAREQLSRLIEREISAASGGGHDLRIVREKVAHQRRAFVTEHRPPRPTGAYASAIARRNEAQQALEAARSAAHTAADRLGQMQALRKRREGLSDPATRGAARERIRGLAQAREAALQARQQLKIAEATAEACESRRVGAKQAYESLKAGLDQARALESAASTGAAATEKLNERLAELGKQLSEAVARRNELRAALDAERTRLRVRTELDGRREAAMRSAEAATRLAEARTAAHRAEEIRTLLREERVTEARISNAQREVASIEALEARIAAQLPKVRITYLPEAAGKIRIGGRPVGDGEVLMPSRSVSFEVDGVGTITVEPPSADVEDDQADLEAHRSVLNDLLAAMGVPDMAAAHYRFEERQRLERELAQAEDRIAARAPEGIQRLAEEVERLELQSRGSGEDDAELPERPVIEAEIERLASELRSSEEAADRLAHEHAATRESLASAIAQVRALREQLAKLNAELPAVEDRSNRLAELEAALSSAHEAANAAVREQSAWREKAPDDAAMRALDAELVEAQRAEESAHAELALVERDLAVIEREIERDRQDGVELQVQEMEQRVRSCDEQVRQFERELAAMDLLLDTLNRVEQQSRDRYLIPVLQRLDPYLSLLFPGAKVGIGRDLGVEAVNRGTVSEALSGLSDGTQEQIAVLVRLAFARLLADAGRPTPLILDDALVYADDIRIESLFAALRQAAGTHQVIVFTCRSRAFEKLGGKRLSVIPWAVN